MKYIGRTSRELGGGETRSGPPPPGCGGAGNKLIGCGVMILGSGTPIGRRIRAATAMATVAGLTGRTGKKAGVLPWTMDEMRTASGFSG